MFLFAVVPAQAAITAQDVIDRAIEAQGGSEALEAVGAQRQIGTTKIFMRDELIRDAPFLLLGDGHGRSYYETPRSPVPLSDQLVFAFDGESGWTQNDGALAPYAMPAEEVNAEEEAWPYFFRLKERGVSIAYVGESSANGVACHELEYSFAEGHVERVFFRIDDGLLHMRRRNIVTSIGDAEVEYTASDYQRVGSVLLAHTNQSYFPPDERHVRTVEKWELNPAFRGDEFTLPVPPPLTELDRKALVGCFSTDGGVGITVRDTPQGLALQIGEEPEAVLTSVSKTYFLYRRFAQEKSKSRMANVFFQDFPEGRAQRVLIINSSWEPLQARRKAQ